MTIQWIRQTWDGRSGGAGLNSPLTTSGDYLVKTDDKTDTELDILTDGASPYLGQPHPTAAGLYIEDIQVKQMKESPFFWKLSVKYTNEFTTEDGESPSKSGSTPEFDPAVIEWTTENFQLPVEEDTSGNGIVNSAGDPFDPLPVKDEMRVVCNISYNAASVPSTVLSFANKINSSSVTMDGLSIAKGEAKCQSVRVGGLQVRNGDFYRNVQFSFAILEGGWDLSILDQGFREREPRTNDLINITNDGTQSGDGAQVTSPALLDGAGHKLADPSPADAVFLSFTIYDGADFTLIPGIT